MQVSRAYVKQFADYMNSVNEAAGKTIITQAKKKKFIERLEVEGDLAITDISLTISEICGASSKLASALTCQFYDGIRQQAKLPTKFNAELWDGYSKQTVNRAVNAICNEVLEGKNTVPLVSLLVDLAYRETNKATNWTVRNNVKKDPSKPKYAIVPNGDACAFCVMRASLGYTYGSESAVESHAHCTCVPTPVFGDMKIQGYDSKAYRDIYDEAAKAYKSGDISEETRSRISAAKERHDKKYEAGLTDRAWEPTNAILIVMRDQQGIK